MKALTYRTDFRDLRDDGPCLDPNFIRAVLGEPVITVKQVNDLAARQLMSAERSYWEAFLARSDSREDCELALKHLNELDQLEASRG